jgi:LysM repeat protein
MVTLTVTLPASITAAPPKYRMYMETTDRRYRFGALIAPLEVDYSGFSNTWSEIPRAGRAPYLVREASKLATMDFTINLVYPPDPDYSVQGWLNHLIGMSRHTAPVNLTYGGTLDTRLWRMTNLGIHVLRRHPVTSAPTHAHVDVQLTQASDIKLSSGPISGGKSSTSSSKTTSKSKKTTSSKSSSKKKSKIHYYKVKKGDNITRIAIRVYGNAASWRRLADLNNLKNPKKLKVGQRLRY